MLECLSIYYCIFVFIFFTFIIVQIVIIFVTLTTSLLKNCNMTSLCQPKCCRAVNTMAKKKLGMG
ncbi:hypothetical protein K450DRAFT_227047 [Umbelopsis ramanniana AG]|uniref:Uncharacterized protein n=1 Tax=Umbelopsis ramanniana AG TaxID=1314678 RepID=A0AAD5EFC8_UMBRA|nr:uncharacterized protein K450DRAFT_227047 [Umbelopsis ramanniana AG]KAI8582412.1 hypothetical protein K450DRAFT_227047 [Umbelopsis ramanniana AG]